MVKIIVIFTIVFVIYCEINAQLYYLQNKLTATADIQNPLETEKDSIQTQTNRYTNGSREDNNGLSEFVQSDSEAHINIFFKPGVVNSHRFNKPGVVNRRRFNKIHTVEENTETDELDTEIIKHKERVKYHHHSRKNMTKKHDSANSEGKEINKKDEKDMMEIDNSSGSSEKLHTQKKRFKIKDRDDQKKSKQPKDTKMNHVREKDKKKHVKEKNKGKKEEKKMDKVKGEINKLSMATTQSSKNDKINKSKQLKGKRSHTQNEPSKNKKSKDVLRLTKANSEQSKTTIKVTKPLQRIISETKPTTTKSSEPNPKPTEKMLKEKQKGQRQLILRAYRPYSETGKHMRSTKLSALYLDDDKKKGHPHSVNQLREGKDITENLYWSFPNPRKLSPSAIISQMNELKNKFPLANVTVTKSARTVEYNDIVMVTFKEGPAMNASPSFRTHESKYMDEVPEKKIIFIVHGLTVMGLKHVTSLVDTRKLELLVSYYLKHLDKFDFIVMPLANPDGYSASLASDRKIWNKNVSPQDVCSGVFVDRNFDVSWNDSHDISPCSHLYPGATAFSEEESKAVRDVLHQYHTKIEAYIHVHAGTFDDKTFKGEAVLYPTESDDDKYIDMKAEIDEMMKNASFRVRKVTVDTLTNWYGLVQGTSVDYAASVYGIPYALEFVMQIYDNEQDSNTALKEIWSRVIDTTFTNMWKNLQRGTADARRKHV